MWSPSDAVAAALVAYGISATEATWKCEFREAHRLFIEVGAPIRAEEVAKELGG